jgi:hypothetical protein
MYGRGNMTVGQYFNGSDMSCLLQSVISEHIRHFHDPRKIHADFRKRNNKNAWTHLYFLCHFIAFDHNNTFPEDLNKHFYGRKYKDSNFTYYHSEMEHDYGDYIELLAPSIIESAITINKKNPDSEVTDDEYTKWAHMLVRKANIKYEATKYAK